MNTRIFPSAGRWAVAALAVVSLARPAFAHFFWVRITSEQPSKIRLVFAESFHDGTTPDLLARITTAQAWVPGRKPFPLTAAKDALDAPLPRGETLAAVDYTWGVVSRGDAKPFLLHYYAKAAKDEESAAKPTGLPMEVFARREGNAIHLRVVRGGRPEKGAELKVDRPNDPTQMALITDGKGEAHFALKGGGPCAIRARAIVPKGGVREGKPYAEQRFYSTLTFSAR